MSRRDDVKAYRARSAAQAASNKRKVVAAARDLRMAGIRATPANIVAAVTGGPQRNRLQEHKTFDYNTTGGNVACKTGWDAPVASTPFVFKMTAGAPDYAAGVLNQIPVGNSSITRIGRRVQITALALRGQVYSGSAGRLNKVCLLIVWDRFPNKPTAMPPFNTILDYQASDALTNKTYAPRFKILRRYEFTLAGNENSGAMTDSSIQTISDFIKLKNKVTIWTPDTTDGLITSMVEGGLYAYWSADCSDSTEAPIGLLNTRVYFQDS